MIVHYLQKPSDQPKALMDQSRMHSEEMPPTEMMKNLSLRERPESRVSITPISTSPKPTTTTAHLPPVYSEVDPAAPVDKLVERPLDRPRDLSPPLAPADAHSTSRFSQPDAKEPRCDLPSANMPIIQTIQEDVLRLPLHNNVPIGQNVDTSSASTPTLSGSRKPARKIQAGRKPDNICPYDIESWRFGTPVANAEMGGPDICWCNQCFQSESPLENRICFGTSDGYVEVWTDKAKAAIFSSSPSFCSCRTLPFYLETVTKYDFYKDNPQKLRDNSPKRKYLLSCRTFHISSTKDSKLRDIDPVSAQIGPPPTGKGFLQTPPTRHMRRSSAPENAVVLLGEHSQSANRTNLVRPEIRGPPEKSSRVTSLMRVSKPAQFNVSTDSAPRVPRKEICWCSDFCWVTRVRRARKDQGDARLEPRSNTEIGHRVFFSSAGGEIEVWTDLPKPKNAFTGVEKATCKMAPRHISRVVKVDMSTDRLTHSGPKREHLLNSRESSNLSALGFERSTTVLWVYDDAGRKTGKQYVPALKEPSLREKGGLLAGSSTTPEQIRHILTPRLLRPPQIGRHHRRSSAPEALEKKLEPPTARSATKRYRLANGRVVIVRMPPAEMSSPSIEKLDLVSHSFSGPFNPSLPLSSLDWPRDPA